MQEISLLVLFLLLLLGQSSTSSLRQDSVSGKKCSEKQLETFQKQQDQAHSSCEGNRYYHLKVKEKPISSTLVKNSNYLRERDQLVEYQSKQLSETSIRTLWCNSSSLYCSWALQWQWSEAHHWVCYPSICWQLPATCRMVWSTGPTVEHHMQSVC